MEFEQEDIEERIKVWLTNGVTYKEIQERLSWLGLNYTELEIKLVEEKNS